MALRAVRIDDKYALDKGTALLTGAQALVRALIQQSRADRAAGRNTGGYVSGYRGSPLGGVDAAMLGAKTELDAANVVFAPGLNEDLAATAINGTQQLAMFGPAKVDGVFALWYGKAPGVERSGDAFKHGAVAGAAKLGGVVLAFGDDHAGKSSTTAHQCEQAIAANQIPIFYPATVQEIVTYSLYGWAMSRFTGLWTAVKLVNETAETAATIDVSGALPTIHAPNDVEFPEGGVNFQGGIYDPLGDEARISRYRLPLAHAFVRANAINRITLDARDAALCIVSAGKAYSDTLHALRLLGVDAAANPGVRVFKLGVVWPLEPEGVLAAMAGCAEALVVEEKRAFIEEQAARILVNRPDRPLLTGKTDETGAPLLPPNGVLDPAMIAIVIGERLLRLGRGGEALRTRVEMLKRRHAPVVAAGSPARVPYYCSGCPHNTSTKTLEGSMAGGGTGCHSMALWMNRATKWPVTQMGGEGADWIGASNFSKREHVFQNLGDGTFSHSGLLSIRAAVISRTTMTFKLLFNDAVAMTGGQALEGHLDVPQAAAMVKAAGAARVVVVSEKPERLEGRMEPGIPVHGREDFDDVQRELAATPGVTVLIFDQVCAAEKRRRRKRGLMEDPDRRVFINEDVCEGCGDCSVKSNCVSVAPKETALGRKREIDQSSCNKDYSCVNGFCPAFVSVRGSKPKTADWSQLAKTLERDLPAPPPREIGAGFAALITGIGGTGVITVGQVLAMAAHLEGKGAATYNMTGLAQKGGAVMSHLRMTATPEEIGVARVGAGEADLLLGCDMVTAGGGEALASIDAGRTHVVINSRAQPTAAFTLNRDFTLRTDLLVENIKRALGDGADRLAALDATDIARVAFGDTLAANLLLVGYAFQKGVLPLSAEAIEQAIKLNGAGAAINRAAFRLGRLAVADKAAFDGLVSGKKAPAAKTPETLQEIVAHREALLTAYQNSAYAARYRAVVDRVAAAESKARPGETAVARAVAVNLAKLMAYKDEYEVARLYADPAFARRLGATFGGDISVSYHLAPPAMGEKKREFGAWMGQAFRVLAALKGLRGGAFDVFGYTAERRAERQDIETYLQTIEDALARVTSASHAGIASLLNYPDEIRGFGHVKESGRKRALAQRDKALAALSARALAEVA